MVTFTPDNAVPGLYTAPTPEAPSNWGWLGYVLPGAAISSPFGLTDAFGTYSGSFVFMSAPPIDPTTLVSNVKAYLTAKDDGYQRCFWLDAGLAVTDASGFAFNVKQGVVRVGYQFALSTNLSLSVLNGAAIGVSGDELSLTLAQGPGAGQPVAWGGPSAPQGLIGATTLHFDGPQRGCLEFAQNIARADMYNKLNWGFQTMFADSSSTSGLRPGWYPLADTGSDLLGIDVLVDPLDPYNETLCSGDRTAFAFNDPTTSLSSGYRTTAGWVVTLQPVVTAAAGQEPARLWLHRSPLDTTSKRDFVSCPVGDFWVGVTPINGGTAAIDLLCGLSGTESISLDPGSGPGTGDRLRFSPQLPAYAKGYPYPLASPVKPPVDASADKLDKRYKTSWAALQPAGGGSGGHYAAQPKGASLYAKPGSGPSGVLTATQPGMSLSPSTPLPLFPYGLVCKGTGITYALPDYQEIEQSVVAPARRIAISKSPTQLAAAPPAAIAAKAAAGGIEAAGDGSIRATTPTGLVVVVEEPSGMYAEIDLGQRVSQAPQAAMKITQATPGPMQDAFQTSDLFLVAAAPGALGPLQPLGGADTAPGFWSSMPIGDWTLAADVGTGSSYGDYANVVIVKGRRGSLQELVKSPRLWTQPELAIPAGADASELVVLSGWLQSYFEEAEKQTSDYFDNFKRIIELPDWTGVLVLKADVKALPADLNGLLGGMDQTRFNAHHFGFAITNVDPTTVTMEGDSATFGLIYYVDPSFVDVTPAAPIQPKTQPYGFTVLTLKVLFENAAVQRFESYAQLSLQQLFGQAVDHMGGVGENGYDALILTGALQKHGTTTTYSLGTEGDAAFFFNPDKATKLNGVFNKIEIVQAQFSTQGTAGNTVTARFDLYGFLDFVTLQAGGAPLDLFSFGSADGKTLRQGLSFSALGVNMVFDESNHTKPPVFAFDTSRIAFDVARSQTRTTDVNLFQSLQLKVDRLMSGDASGTPSDLGYLDVGTDAALSGISDAWYGIRFAVDFGTPGALAGKVGLTSYLLLAWSPPKALGDAGEMGASLLLPGAGPGSSLLSLQGVLKLSVGPIQLKLVPTADASGQDFMLVMNEIALRFMGLLKLPPSGATAFYLFGGPETGDAPAGPLGWFGLYKGPDPPAPPSNGQQLTSGEGG